MSEIKSIDEIKEEIMAAKKTMDNFKKAFENDEVSEETLNFQITDNEATIEILKWSLENENRRTCVSLNEYIEIFDAQMIALSEYYSDNKVERDHFLLQNNQMSAKIAALKWILGENDRYD